MLYDKGPIVNHMVLHTSKSVQRVVLMLSVSTKPRNKTQKNKNKHPKHKKPHTSKDRHKETLEALDTSIVLIVVIIL